MELVGSLPPADIYSTWSENIEVLGADDDEPIDFTSVTEATLRLLDWPSGFAEMTLTFTNGDIVFPAPGIIQWRAEATAMGTLFPKLYKAVMTLVADGDTITLVLGTISITE